MILALHQLELSDAGLIEATQEVVRALNECNRSASLLADVQLELDLAEAQAQADGLPGSNEAQRKANLRLQLSEEHASVFAAEAGLRDARRDLDVARARLDCMRFQLRLRDVTLRESNL